ncbi:bifunctional DNA primase/polymerase [Streptomyces sp. NPDC059650]|uniref:bifunctional DNA primase/polymerase n=1 Tax=Streptomyces sp. NPDC059650 TaxID=3346896 RepID=UPI00369EC827
MTTPTPDPLRVALWLAAQGYAVHPLAPGAKLPVRGCDRCAAGTKERPNPHHVPHDGHGCECIAVGRPCHGVLAATTDAERIAAWWAWIPSAGVGVAAGPSGLVILDVDCHGGQPPEEQSELLPGVETAATPSHCSSRRDVRRCPAAVRRH